MKKINKDQQRNKRDKNVMSIDRRGFLTTQSQNKTTNICTNSSCRLRKAGCRGFVGCPGYMAR